MANGKHIWWIGMLLSAFLSSCVPHSVREARDVVAQADSLWHAGQMYGVDAGDSATLAQAYKTFEAWQWVEPTAYAHTCYHYGKLLRAKDNPVAAMEVFINATHSHTRDYHILGRVYSNIGSICHLAGEFPLSYDMYQRSAECFLYNNDTISYYYALNDMAFELAMLAEKDSVFIILDKIKKECSNSNVLIKIQETRAEVCLRKQEYDSALLYAAEACGNDSCSVLARLILAQTYSRIERKDSAVYHAKRVLELSSNLADKHNALYILTNDDESKDKASIRETASMRADNQKLLEIQHGAFKQASLLLEQDINRKPNLKWLYAVSITILVIVVLIAIYVRMKRKKHTLLSQKMEHLEAEYIDFQETKENKLEQICNTLRASPNIQNDLCWKNFEKMCSFVNENFYFLANKLRQTNVLNETEIRLCVLVLIGLSRAQIASTLPYAPNSVGKLKDHTAKLLGTTGKNLRIYLLKLVIE